jgi:DNA-binding NarL/FixJ family response regulator
MDQNTAKIAIVSRPGPMQATLEIVLASIPWIKVVGAVGNHEAALNLVTEHCPRLLVVDSNFTESQTLDLIRAIKTLHPNIGCLVFNQTSQQKMLALEAGADLVLPRDNASSNLAEYLQHLITITEKNQPPETENLTAEMSTDAIDTADQVTKPDLEEGSSENSEPDKNSIKSTH